MNARLQYAVEIPGGLWRDGLCVRQATLRSLSGEDEAFLLEAGESLSAPSRATMLLSRCLLRLGNEQEVTHAMVRSLTAGDREALLLHLRRITYGESLPSLLSCSNSGCGQRLDLDLKVSQLLAAPYESPREWNEISPCLAGTAYSVRFRVPNGLDQELLAEHYRNDPAGGEGFLLERCVQDVSCEGFPLSIAQWPAELAHEIGQQMSDLDPQAETLLSLQCSYCGHTCSGEFDAGAYLHQELHGHVPYLYREVHQMARSYHWSEAEILSMTPRRRSMYLDLLAEEGVIA